MKKVILAMAIVSIAFTACNGSDSDKSTNDSTKTVVVDTNKTTVVDTTKHVMIDTVKKPMMDTTKKSK